MGEPIQILTAQRDGDDGLIVTFSDVSLAKTLNWRTIK
jgi:hypothetical protein